MTYVNTMSYGLHNEFKPACPMMGVAPPASDDGWESQWDLGLVGIKDSINNSDDERAIEIVNSKYRVDEDGRPEVPLT